jgi:hypothetical protein
LWALVDFWCFECNGYFKLETFLKSKFSFNLQDLIDDDYVVAQELSLLLSHKRKSM